MVVALDVFIRDRTYLVWRAISWLCVLNVSFLALAVVEELQAHAIRSYCVE